MHIPLELKPHVLATSLTSDHYLQECAADARLREARPLACTPLGVKVNGLRLPEHPQPLASSHDPVQRAQVRLAAAQDQG